MWEIQRIVFAAGFGRMLVTHREVEEYRFPGSVKLSPSDEQDLRSADAQGRAAGGHRFTFPRSHRLTHAREFEAVYTGKLRKSAGAIALAALPNGLSHPRLGLSIGRRFGGAVARNRLKRLLREAFRLSQHELPQVEGKPGHGGYDYVVSARAHEALTLERYRAMLMDLARACDEERRRREARHGEKFGEKGSGDA